MRFDFVRDPDVPVGAWCLEARRRSDVVRVRHGALVERLGDDGFCFGAWPGGYDPGTLLDSSDRTGSAALIHKGQLVLLAPTHPFTWLNLSRVGDDRLFVSNSLAFVLRATGATPKPYVSSYHSDINHVVFRPDRELHIEFAGPSVHPLMLDVFRIDADLGIHRERRPSAVRFDSFASYRDKVVEVLAGFAANATTSARANPLGLSATVSAGYDSTGSLAMASAAGWRRAVTLIDEHRTDDGTAIANHLGVEVDEVGFDAWRTCRDLSEAAFYTVAGPEARLRFVGLEPHVRRTLMITGGFGDATWDLSTDDVGPRFAQVGSGPPGERSMGEWLLHTGAIGLPVPALGADDFDQFMRLGHAAEMEKWRSETQYDRPVPRRLVVERGVPPEAFAESKLASAWIMAPRGLSPATRADFEAWLIDHPLPVRKTLDRAFHAPIERAFKVSRRYARHSKTTNRLRHWRKLHPTWTTGRLFHWAHDRTRDHYPPVPFD